MDSLDSSVTLKHWPDPEKRFKDGLKGLRKEFVLTDKFEAYDERGQRVPMTELESVFKPGCLIQADCKLRVYAAYYISLSFALLTTYRWDMSEGGRYNNRQKTYQVHMYRLQLIHPSNSIDNDEQSGDGKSEDEDDSDKESGADAIDFSVFNPSPLREFKRASSPSSSSSPVGPSAKRPRTSKQPVASGSGSSQQIVDMDIYGSASDTGAAD